MTSRADAHPILRGLGWTTLLLALAPLLVLLWQAGAVSLEDPDLPGVLWRLDTWSVVGRSAALSAGVAFLCVAIAVPLAWLTHCTDLPGRRLFQVLLNLPLAVPSYVSAFVVMAAFGQSGWIHDLLRPLGVAQMPDMRGAWGAVLALLYAYPFALLTIQASMARQDPRQWEAARSLGASPWRAWWRVIFPRLKPSMATGGLLVGLYVLGDFGAVSLMRFKCLSYVIYLRQGSISDALRHEALFLSLLLVVLAVALVALLQRMGGRVQASLSAQAGFRTWPVVPLGRWKAPSTLFCSLVAGLGLVAPVLVLLGWLLRGLRLAHDISVPWADMAVSTALGALAALAAVGVAVVPALLGRFGKRTDAVAVQWGTLTGYALPGIVVALALVSLVSTHAFSWYQTTRLLLLAYLVRFLPLAIQTLSEALHAQNPRLYDAARSLGASPTQAWRRVILPGASASIWAGWIAVFIAVIKELPMTLLLGPIELEVPGLEEPLPFATLATRIWSLTEDEYFSQVSPIVLLLLGIACLGLLLRPDTRRSRRP